MQLVGVIGAYTCVCIPASVTPRRCQVGSLRHCLRSCIRLAPDHRGEALAFPAFLGKFVHHFAHQRRHQHNAFGRDAGRASACSQGAVARLVASVAGVDAPFGAFGAAQRTSAWAARRREQPRGEESFRSVQPAAPQAHPAPPQLDEERSHLGRRGRDGGHTHLSGTPEGALGCSTHGACRITDGVPHRASRVAHCGSEVFGGALARRRRRKRLIGVHR
mmetsp:Transcript_8514/g.34614  ORF Transcript_8514/g.34614 Transcript_8514/m.34614 type:complete len:219 (+) Transcript_8514:1884-2540(+)